MNNYHIVLIVIIRPPFFIYIFLGYFYAFTTDSRRMTGNKGEKCNKGSQQDLTWTPKQAIIIKC